MHVLVWVHGFKGRSGHGRRFRLFRLLLRGDVEMLPAERVDEERVLLDIVVLVVLVVNGVVVVVVV